MRTMVEHLQAGVGRVDITPPVGTPLVGYPDPKQLRRAESVRDPLHATALAFERGGVSAALIELDVILIEQEDTQAIRAGVAAATGIPADHIIVSAIQTHSGPCTQSVWGWQEKDLAYVGGTLVPSAIQAAVEAWRSRAPARVGIATTPSRVAINRRAVGVSPDVLLGVNPWDVIDPTMTVLRIQTQKGALANVVHYGAHPTVLSARTRVISRDWPGIMIDRMESLTGAKTLFFNGAVGDMAPRTNSGKAVGDETEAALWEAGAAASMDAMAAWRSIKESRDLPVAVLSETMSLPYRPLAPIEEARRQMELAVPEKDSPGAGASMYLHWQSVVETHRSGGAKTAAPYPQVILALGPVAFVPMPGEPFASTVLRLRDVSPFQHTLSLSTSCGSYGYFAPRESLHRGGYEVWVARAMGPYILAENIDDVLIEHSARQLAALQQQTLEPWPAQAGITL